MNKEQHIQDVIDIEDCSISIKNINLMLKNEAFFNNLKIKYKDTLYTSILMTLTHEIYSENRAKKLFEKITAHLNDLNKKLDRDVGISVATVDYLSNIEKSLLNPKIIEEEKSEFFTESTTKDELTELYLRDIFDIFLKNSIKKAQNRDKKLSLAMIDIDDFKNINDTYGHQMGDKVLKKVGQTINLLIRKNDLACRYGGEEIAIVMPNTNLDESLSVSKRICKEIENLKFDEFNITVSIGISELKNFQKSKDLIEMSDKALYEAKANGKNRVVSK